MQKYIELFRLTVDQYFIYRINFLLWRFRMVLNLLIVYFLWTAVYDNTRIAFGYDKPEMITYVLLISIFSDLVFSSIVFEIGAEILNGDIINRLLRPMSFFKYLLTKEVADKSINVTSSLIETTLLLLLLKPALVAPESAFVVVVAAVHLLLGMVMAFLISFCLSMIAFWSAEVWAPRFIYFVLVTMLAGNYFPLNILPAPIYSVIQLSPFPYFVFLPAQLLVQGFSNYNPVSIVIQLFWVGILYVAASKLWQKGMREYSFYGR
ncbi:MAG: ABC transporter permease [Weeksellaceae bacterium]